MKYWISKYIMLPFPGKTFSLMQILAIQTQDKEFEGFIFKWYVFYFSSLNKKFLTCFCKWFHRGLIQKPWIRHFCIHSNSRDFSGTSMFEPTELVLFKNTRVQHIVFLLSINVYVIGTNFFCYWFFERVLNLKKTSTLK